MNTASIRRAAALGVAVLAVPTAAAASNAVHEGSPQQWGPPLKSICEDVDTAAAAAAGYNVIVLNNLPNTFTGTAGADAIFALGGDDRINGGPGDDLLCLGEGDDRGRGWSGNDAVYGEEDDDRIQGNVGDDFLDGGPGLDICVGGAGFDVPNDCEAWVQ